jgi:hypothetical protein
MSFQAYLDTIKEKTGKTPEDFRELARARGLLEPGVKTMQLVDWLKEEFGLGRGHAMAIVNTLGQQKGAGRTPAGKIDEQFKGGKAAQRGLYDALLARAEEFGPVSLAPTNSYISLLNGVKKFAIVQVGADRLDLGIKLASAVPTERFGLSGSWNSMVTHRVRVETPADLDDELIDWLRRAYAAA